VAGIKTMSKGRKEIRIMIVDDESDVTLFCRASLEYYGFKVDVFNEPKEALSNFKPNYYDLVILDIKMPNIGGFELYSKIKENDPNVRACFLTANERYYEEFREKEYSTLAKELFIHKPVGHEEMIEKIKQLISK
jgi:DNA-binding response OmpR family regulator